MDSPAAAVGEVVVKARIGTGRHRELEAREWTGWRYDREQVEVSTYVYDRSSGRFRKEWREKHGGALQHSAEGGLRNQELHGQSGQTGWSRAKVAGRPGARQVRSELS